MPGIAERLLVTKNGWEELTTLAQHFSGASSPALILLDLDLLVMNGIEFLEAYQRRRLSQRRNTVIVVLTTSVNPQDLARMQAMPITG